MNIRPAKRSGARHFGKGMVSLIVCRDLGRQAQLKGVTSQILGEGSRQIVE